MEIILAIGVGALGGLAIFGIIQAVEMLLDIRKMNKKQKEIELRKIIREELKK